MDIEIQNLLSMLKSRLSKDEIDLWQKLLPLMEDEEKKLLLESLQQIAAS